MFVSRYGLKAQKFKKTQGKLTNATSKSKKVRLTHGNYVTAMPRELVPTVADDTKGLGDTLRKNEVTQFHFMFLEYFLVARPHKPKKGVRRGHFNLAQHFHKLI